MNWPAFHEALSCGQICRPIWRCHQVMCGFLANHHLHRVSRQSDLSTNEKAGNDLRPRTRLRSPGIYLTTVESSGKPQLGDRLMNHCLKLVPSPLNDVGMIVQYIWKRDGMKGRVGKVPIIVLIKLRYPARWEIYYKNKACNEWVFPFNLNIY